MIPLHLNNVIFLLNYAKFIFTLILNYFVIIIITLIKALYIYVYIERFLAFLSLTACFNRTARRPPLGTICLPPNL